MRAALPTARASCRVDAPTAIAPAVVLSVVNAVPPAAVVKPLKQRVRSVVFERYGGGMKGVQRFFSAIDSTSSGKWDFQDMVDGFKDFGIPASAKESRAFFDYLDATRVQKVGFESFFVFMKGQLPASRRALVHQAFAKLDTDGDGLITAADLRYNFDGSMNPEVLGGTKTEQQLVQQMVSDFQQRAQATKHFDSLGEGLITLDDFEDYYGAAGAYVDDDSFFSLMVKRAWRLE